LSDGVWDRVAELRNILEKDLEARASSTILVGNAVERLPNTSFLVTPGWRGRIDTAGIMILERD
jgi:cysteine desulfurase